jgi:intracellular multiplication protein IcmL
MQTVTPNDNNQTMIAHLRDDFYRDGFRKVLLSLALVTGATALLIIVSLYFFLHQVLPINFAVYPDWRVLPDVSLDKPYIPKPDLLQWVSNALPQAFTFDFINYDEELKKLEKYFTANGWNKYSELANTLVNHNEILNKKLFVTASADGAPVILNQGIIDQSYAWWVQMPVNVRYSGVEGEAHESKFTIQVLLVRVSTLNNLDGISIENITLNREGGKH